MSQQNWIFGTLIAFAFTSTLVYAQPRPEQKTQMVEQVFKNVQALKNIPVNEFMATMGFFSASLGENCTFCHVQESGGNWARYADDNPQKRTARAMIGMMNSINKSFFAGRRMITCYSCHRGGERPEATPNLAELYGPPHSAEPDRLGEPAPKATPAEQVLDKYIQALGGAQRLASVTSFTAKGTFQGYASEKHPVEVYAKAPGQLTTIVRSPDGDTTTTYDGRAGWIAAPTTDRPVTLLELTGGDLDGAKLDAVLAFPARLKESLTQWRSGFPATIDDRDVRMVQGTMDGRLPVNLYFDNQSGLLVRQVRYTDSPVGLAPMQVDYADYRDVSGVKIPFHWTATWLDGRSTTQLSEVQSNVPIEAAKFTKPK